MKFLIRKILQEELNKREVLLLNKLNANKKELKTKNNILDYIRTTAQLLSLDPKLANYYYQLWRANYRKEGDYGKISPEELIQGKNLPKRTVSNTAANEFTRAKIPFKGKKLEGDWHKDNKGVEYYEVISYDWYPIYIFKDNVWYKIIETYSSSTSRQIWNSNPIDYDENVAWDVIMVTKKEMDMLRDYATLEDIMKYKKEKLLNDKELLLSKKPKFGMSHSEQPIKVKYKITDIRPENDKVVVDVLIIDAGPREKEQRQYGDYHFNRMIPTKGGYLKGEIPGITKKDVEVTVERYIIKNFKEYIGKFPSFMESNLISGEIPEKQNIKFNFIHEKEI